MSIISIVALGKDARAALVVLCTLGSVFACNSAPPVVDPSQSAAKPPESQASSKPVASSAAADSAAAAPAGDPCGGLPCRVFESPEEAFRAVLADKPLVLAIGETHAQKGKEAIASTTSRFTNGFLPELKDKASALVLELWVADGKCGKAKEKHVAEQQKEVTKNQAASDQNEFVTLGEKSKSLGIVPFILRPTCDEYDKIQKAGDDAVLEMLSMITRNMKERAEKLFDENKKKSPDKMIITYGGAMHNDVAPREGREQWSYAKDLSGLAGGRYVELDLIVPEYVQDSESWKSQPWYAAYKARGRCDKTVLFTTTPGSVGSGTGSVGSGSTGAPAKPATPAAYALVFPCSAPSAQ